MNFQCSFTGPGTLLSFVQQNAANSSSDPQNSFKLIYLHMCFAAGKPELNSFQVHYLDGKGFEIFRENCRKQNSFKWTNTGKYFLLFSWAGRKWSGKIVKSKGAWLKSYVRVVSLFSVLAVIMNSLLKEEWLVQRTGADLTQPFSSCFINTILNSCWTGKDQQEWQQGSNVKWRGSMSPSHGW